MREKGSLISIEIAEKLSLRGTKCRSNLFIIFFFLLICFRGNLSLAQAQLEYTASGGRDPFESQLPQPEPLIVERPGVTETIREPVRPPEWTVEGVVSGGSIPLAVIQDKVVRVGDTIEEAVITNITKEGVEVIYEEETFMIFAPSRAKASRGGQNGQ